MNGTKLPPIGKDITELSIARALARRWSRPEWAFLEQVRNRTGYGGRERYADAIALNCYPSRGMELLGFEIKVSRGDWRRELEDPDKSCAIQKFCNRWWIAAPAGVVQQGELPPTWGLVELKGKRLVVHTDAPPLEPVALDRAFVASVLRNAAAAVESSPALEAAKAEGYEAGKAAVVSQMQRAAARQSQTIEELRRTIHDFQDASGVTITVWDARRIGAAVKFVLETPQKVATLRNTLDAVLATYDNAIPTVREAVKKFDDAWTNKEGG